LHKEGVFAATIPGEQCRYRLLLRDWHGMESEVEDPYRFGTVITGFDLHLHSEGKLYEAWNTLGAHPMTMDGVEGVHFAVWAPNAEVVTVAGDFNFWDTRRHPMRLRDAGVWEIFLPGATAGDAYKYLVRSRHQGYQQLKADPFGFGSEKPPKSASIVCDLDEHQWGDADWMESRGYQNWLHAPVSVYEVHLESWRRDDDGQPLTYRELAAQLVPYVSEMGYTHVELMPVQEHPFSGSWGYQVTGYFAPTARFGPPADFMYFVDVCHQAGIGVIMDWVPAHFPKDAHGLAYFDGTALYEHADPRQGEHRDWGTLIFNYGRNEVREFLVSNALFWLKRYHIDGLRVDAVASMLYLDYSRKEGEWLPNAFGGRENLEAIDFLRRFNEVAHTVPGAFTVAEESTAFPGVSRPVYAGGLGFTMKWNMGWMHDMLHYFSEDPVHRKYHHNNITFSMLYAFSENFLLPISHDEVVYGKRSLIGKMPGDQWQKFANARAFLGYMYTHPGKKLLFMGCDIGTYDEWNSNGSVPWDLLHFPIHDSLRSYVRELNRVYREHPALHEVDAEHTGFEWIDFSDVDQSSISFLRRARDADEFVVVACNFTPVPRENYAIGVPEPGYYREILNSDAGIFGGSNIGNSGGVMSDEEARHGRPHSITITLPPLAVVAFRPER
ncbi:MAG TPA: 1,4-alpha-glucan branching protein GlgB, partial [Bryobacteraceae bacterium]|nr:1,4-alpha-glucan branching protein GlgB [Bryobacteraceae bacterium]